MNREGELLFEKMINRWQHESTPLNKPPLKKRQQKSVRHGPLGSRSRDKRPERGGGGRGPWADGSARGAAGCTEMSSPGRSPARRAGKGQLPNLKGTPQHAISPYRKAAAESLRGSWKSVALPDIPGQGPAGPAGPVEGPLSPDPAFQAKEGKALSAWVQAAQNGDAEAQNNIGVSYYRGINGAQKVSHLCACRPRVLVFVWPRPHLPSNTHSSGGGAGRG